MSWLASTVIAMSRVVIEAGVVATEGRMKAITRNTSTVHKTSPKFAAQNDPIKGRSSARVLNPTATVITISAA